MCVQHHFHQYNNNTAFKSNMHFGLSKIQGYYFILDKNADDNLNENSHHALLVSVPW